MKTHSGRAAAAASASSKFVDNRELEEMEQQQSGGGGKMSVRMGVGLEAAAGGLEAATEAVASSRSSEKVSFADLRKQKARDHFHTSGINITYNADGGGR